RPHLRPTLFPYTTLFRSMEGFHVKRALGFVVLGAAFALAAVVTAQHVIAQQKTPKKAIYTITTKDISVGLSANSSIPQTLGYWRSEEHTSELQSRSDLVC